MSVSPIAVSWDRLLTYPGSRYRIYSAPLAVERFVFIVSHQAPGTRAELHAHPDAEEIYVLVSGDAGIELGEETLRARPLDAFRAAPRTLHANFNDGDKDAYWLVIASPVDEFVAESDWYASGSTRGLDLDASKPASVTLADRSFGRPSACGSVSPRCGSGLPATAVGWAGLRDYPGSRYRIYSAPLGVEHFVFIVSRQPPGAGAEMHAHSDAEEIYVLLSGAGRIQLGDEVFDARPLDGFRAAPGVMHANSNPSDEEIFWLVMASPLAEFVATSEWYHPGSTIGILDSR
jgi:mannose-6-phosphate isomerase-like protein (cupin superfamily)